MKKNIKQWVCSLLILSILLSCAGCADKNNTSSAKGYLELVNSPSTTLNNVWYNTGGIFRCAVFEALLQLDADMQTIKPALAKSYKHSDDGLYYEFVLRDDVTWHDGEPFDAEDVLYSMQAVLRSEEINGSISSAFMYIEGAEAYKNGEAEEISGVTVNGNQVTIQLISPIGGFLNAMTQFAILPEHILGSVEPSQLEQHDYWKNPIGCGPYCVAEVSEDKYFILVRNQNYYGEKPGIAKMHLYISMDDCVTAMQENTLDFYVTNDPEEIAKLKGIEDCSGHRLNILFPAYLIFNLSDDAGVNEYLKDTRVRQALLMAIDRETIVEAIFPGSTVSDTLVPSWDSWYLEDGEAYEFDPKAAKALLEEAGFDFEKTIRLRYFTKGKSTEDLMNAIAVYWRAIGIDVELEMFDGSGSQHMFQTRDYDVCYKRLSAFNHAAIYEEMAGDGVMQSSIYNQPVYDDLLIELNQTIHDESRKNIVNQMQQLDQEYLFRLPLFSLANVAYVNENHFEMPEAYGNLWYRYDMCFEDWKLVN